MAKIPDHLHPTFSRDETIDTLTRFKLQLLCYDAYGIRAEDKDNNDYFFSWIVWLWLKPILDEVH